MKERAPGPAPKRGELGLGDGGLGVREALARGCGVAGPWTMLTVCVLLRNRGQVKPLVGEGCGGVEAEGQIVKQTGNDQKVNGVLLRILRPNSVYLQSGILPHFFNSALVFSTLP